jgi:hypothetical protein
MQKIYKHQYSYHASTVLQKNSYILVVKIVLSTFAETTILRGVHTEIETLYRSNG